MNTILLYIYYSIYVAVSIGLFMVRQFEIVHYYIVKSIIII